VTFADCIYVESIWRPLVQTILSLSLLLGRESESCHVGGFEASFEVVFAHEERHTGARDELAEFMHAMRASGCLASDGSFVEIDTERLETGYLWYPPKRFRLLSARVRAGAEPY